MIRSYRIGKFRGSAVPSVQVESLINFGFFFIASQMITSNGKKKL
jgi:hypothetical protein